MKEGLIKDSYELFIKEIQTLLTLAYVIAVGIGMLFNYKKYSEFEINIFEYGDVFDFLIAPFSDFYVLLFSISSILIVYILFVFDSFWKNKWPKSYSIAYLGRDKKSWFNIYRNSIFAITLIFYLFFAANKYGSFTKGKIINQPDITIKMVDNEIKTGKLIGKTNDIIFLIKDENVYAIPISSLVREIKIK
jgi:hypothetical protein